MRVCVGCQGVFKDDEVDSKFNKCSMCIGYKVAEDNMNMILPILNKLGISYNKKAWDDGIYLDLGKNITLDFANAGGVNFRNEVVKE